MSHEEVSKVLGLTSKSFVSVSGNRRRTYLTHAAHPMLCVTIVMNRDESTGCLFFVRLDVSLSEEAAKAQHFVRILRLKC